MRRRLPPDSIWLHPVDEIEPEPDNISDTAEMLSSFLRCVAEQSTACKAGKEAIAHIALAMPEQFPGGFVLPSIQIEGNYRQFGRAFSRLFACITGNFHRSSMSEAGIRAMMAVYIIRPDLLGGATLEELGARLGGSTRQNLSKHARAIRDAHKGIKNRSMKSEETRRKCRQTQSNR